MREAVVIGSPWQKARARLLRRAASAIVLLVLAGAATAHDEVPGAAQEAPVLLRGGDLYTVSGGVLSSTDLLFAAGEIVAIGRDLEPPPGTEVVDVAGQRVYPGLIAPNISLGLSEIGAVRATDDQTEVGDVTPEVAAHTAYNPDSELIPTVRSNGITTVQVTPRGSLIRGRSSILHLDGWTREDAAVRLFDAMHLGWPQVAVSDAWWRRESPEEQRRAMAETRRQLRRVFDAARGYAAAREAEPERPLDQRWEAMAPVLRGEVPLFVGADDYRQIVEAVAFAAEQGARLVIVGGREAAKVGELLRERDVPVVLGSTTALPIRQDEDYDDAFKIPRLLHEAGVRFCIAHDPRGPSAVRNLAFQAGQAVAFGLPQDVGLRALTLSTAEILGIDDRLGSLDVGKEATLFVSRGDVMDTLGQRVHRMWIRGREVELDDRHKELYRKYREKVRRAAAGRR